MRLVGEGSWRRRDSEGRLEEGGVLSRVSLVPCVSEGGLHVAARPPLRSVRRRWHDLTQHFFHGTFCESRDESHTDVINKKNNRHGATSTVLLFGAYYSLMSNFFVKMFSPRGWHHAKPRLFSGHGYEMICLTLQCPSTPA